MATEEAPGLAQHLPSGVRCVGVLSGKGGVGKSLVTGLLAAAFARSGHAMGILDADLTGPSIPRMFGVRHADTAEGEHLAPARTSHLGIRIMSLNLLMEREDDAVIWRGPLAAKTAALVNTPIIGLVENMAHVICPRCGEHIDLFGAGEGPNAAGTSGLPVLARVPVDPTLSALCDRGEVGTYHSNPFHGLVNAVARALEAGREGA